VDKDIGNNRVEGIYKTIQSAINEAPPGAVIKISPGIYDEHLEIRYVQSSSFTIYRKPGLTLEPKERGGEVTLQQYTRSCVIVELQPGETCSINNLRMIFKGPNKDEDIHW
jgi:hypothetical protein